MCETRTCRKCGSEYPLTHAHFGYTPSKTFRHACKRCMAAATAAHSAKNPEMVRKRLQKRKEQEIAAGRLSTQEKEEHVRHWRKQQNDRCHYCGVNLSGGGELDHRTPVSRGGTNHPENMRLACLQCNRDKHNKTAEQFRIWRQERGLPVAF